MRLFPFLILLFIYSCHSAPELSGHFHLIHNQDYEIESTIDFLNDTSFAYQSRPPYYGGWQGYVDHASQTMYWGGECMTGNWRYTLSPDKHWNIYSLDDKDHLIGTLVPYPGCSGIDDFFLDSKMSIDLPFLSDTLRDIGPPSLTSYLYVGPVKVEYRKVYPGSWFVALGDKIMNPDDPSELKLFDEQHCVKLPEKKRHLVKKVVFLDKDVPTWGLEPIVEHYCDTEVEYLYLAGTNSYGQLVYSKKSLVELDKEINALAFR